MSQVCRTCLEVFENGCQLFSLEINEPALGTVHIKTKLEACVPEIDLHRVRNSAICRYCLFALNTAYDFKTKCIQSETRLFKYLTGETIDSLDLYRFLKRNTNYLLSCDRVNQISEINGESNTASQLPRPPLPFQAVPPLPAAPSLPHYSHFSGPPMYRGTLLENGPPPRSLPAPSLMPPNPFLHTSPMLPSRPYLSTGAVPLLPRSNLVEGPLQSRSCSTTGSLLPPPPPPPPYPSLSRIDMPLSSAPPQATDASLSSRLPPSVGSLPPADSSLRECLSSHPLLPSPPFMARPPLSSESHLSSSLIPMRLPPTDPSLSAGSSLPGGSIRGPPLPTRPPFPPRFYFERPPPQPPLFNSVINNNPQHTINFRPPENENNRFVLVNNVTNTFSHKCSVCQQCFTSSDILNRHMSCHVNPEGLKCSMCDFQTNSTVCLDEHLKSHNMLASMEQYPLPQPMDVSSAEPSSSTTEKPSTEHCVATVGELLHHCGLCNFRSSHSSSLRRHMKVHVGSRPYRCTECRYGAPDEVTLQTHMKVHFRKRPYKCSQCSFAALHNSKLRSHMEKIHGVLMDSFEANVENGDQSSEGSLAVDPYHITVTEMQSILQEEDEDSSNTQDSVLADVTLDSPETGSEVDRPDPYMITVEDIKRILESNDFGVVQNEKNGILNSETQNGQSNGKVFRCGVCKEQFKYLYLYKRHMNIHSTSNKTQLTCTRCDFRTTIKSHLQVHMKSHTGGKFYQCEKCPYSTIYWSNFQKHKRVHTGEKPFKCPFCDYRASQQTSLKAHMNTHPENMSYKCNECPYSTNTEAALLSHVEMHSIGGHFIEDGLSNNFIADSIRRHFTLNNLSHDLIGNASNNNFIQATSYNGAVQNDCSSRLMEEASDIQCNQESLSNNDQNDNVMQEAHDSCDGAIHEASNSVSVANSAEESSNNGVTNDLSQEASSSIIQELLNNQVSDSSDFRGLSDSGIDSLHESSNPNNESIQSVSGSIQGNNSGWKASNDLIQGLSNSDASNRSENVVQEVFSPINDSVSKSLNLNSDLVEEICNPNNGYKSNPEALDNFIQKSSNNDASNRRDNVNQEKSNLGNDSVWKSCNFSNDFIEEISGSCHSNDLSLEISNNLIQSNACKPSDNIIQEVSDVNNESVCKSSNFSSYLSEENPSSDHSNDLNREVSNKLIQESLYNNAANPNDVIQSALNFNNNSSNDLLGVSNLDFNNGLSQEVSNSLIQGSSNDDSSNHNDDVIEEVSDLINDSFWKLSNSSNNLIHDVSNPSYSNTFVQDASNSLIQESNNAASNPNDAMQAISSRNNDSGWKSCISSNDFIPQVF